MESVDFLINAASNIANSISHKLHPPSPVITRSDIVALEEDERKSRDIHAAQSKVHKDNAARISALVSQAPHPFSVQPGKGFKSITRSLEEVERNRRISTKAEYSLRRVHASKVAGIVQSLGWPFYKYDLHQGATYTVVDPTVLAEEEERANRISDPLFIMTAKNNAAVVSSLIRWRGSVRLSTSKRYTRILEEKERNRRLASPQEAEDALYNAACTSDLIRSLGWPFFHGELDRSDAWISTHQMEEKERQRRLEDISEQQLAQEMAGKVSGLVYRSKDDAELYQVEEEEHKRRIKNAKRAAGLVKKALEEQTISGAHIRRLAGLGSPVPSRTAGGLHVSKQSIILLEERERERRMRDHNTQYRSIGLARQVSGLFLSQMSNASTRGVQSSMELERQRRMYDHQGKRLAMRNARKVSGFVLGLSQGSATLRAASVDAEERERQRRMQEEAEQLQAKLLAREVSALIKGRKVRRVLSESDLERSVLPGIPVSRLPTQNMSLPSSPVPFSPMTDHVTSAPSPMTHTYQPCPDHVRGPQLPTPEIKRIAASVVQTAADPSSISRLTPMGYETMPVSAPRPPTSRYLPLQHSVSAPNLIGNTDLSLATQQRAIPLSKALFSATPIVGAPLPAAGYVTPCISSSLPGQPSRASLRASNSLPVFSSTPPLSVRFSPISTSYGSAPSSAIPAAPSSTVTAATTTRLPAVAPSSYSFPSAGYAFPAYSYQAPASYNAIFPPGSIPPISTPVVTPAAQLSEKEQKRLEKTAARHSKLAEKAQKKASKDLAKANNLQEKGKGSRAVRYQNRAEQNNAIAQQHADFAAIYQKDMTTPVSSTISSPGILTAGRPNM